MEMAVLLTALLLLYIGFTQCVEQDTFTPVRVDPGEYEHQRRVDAQQVLLKLSAFREDFYLDLEPDSSFVVPESGADVAHCFYSGRVNSDEDSFAALSLCGGLRGGFSVGGMEYFVSRAPGPGPEAGLGTHVIQRHAYATVNFSRCAVPPHAHLNVSLDRYKHLRDLEDVSERVLSSMGRNKRFASVPHYVEVLLVADESMAEFHGDDLKHYVLTLMSVAARLYKHPSILNSINLVVVGFMVLSDADKGPKVSSNAALTLRNFCSWQKKLNKHSDKHPEYWDTAILFTKQVGHMITKQTWENYNLYFTLNLKVLETLLIQKRITPQEGPSHSLST